MHTENSRTCYFFKYNTLNNQSINIYWHKPKRNLLNKNLEQLHICALLGHITKVNCAYNSMQKKVFVLHRHKGTL